jgi:PPK2 family polyphosphate:nucleotide phosphotransferase
MTMQKRMRPMKIDVAPFRVEEDEKVSLNDRPTHVEPLFPAKADYAAALAEHAERLEALQEKLYAASTHALLIILQGMDSAGKDGAIKHVMTGINPQGCKIASFKTPTPIEARHDFLWRAVLELPERGMIGVFNRSYYEAVLIERVHPELLATEGVVHLAPEKLDKFWDDRLRAIRHFERHLTESGTALVKIFLHISKDTQRLRLLERIDDPTKAWKASLNDVNERRFWKDYRQAYEATLSATSASYAPWRIVPGDDKGNARLFVSQIVIEELERLPLDPPPLSETRKKDLEQIRAALQEK